MLFISGLPEAVYERILEFYNKNKADVKAENWGGRGNTYVNRKHELLLLEGSQLSKVMLTFGLCL